MRSSLRWRIGIWTVGVFTITLAIFTAADMWQEREALLRNEAGHAGTFLAHLVKMPEFGGDSSLARSAIADLQRDLSGARILLRDASRERDPGGYTAASHPIRLDDGTFVLEYVVLPARLRALARRSILVHVVHALVALIALVAITDSLLHRRMLDPLGRIAQQMRHVRRGGGWIPALPKVDEELAGVTAAFDDLAPELQRQMGEWIDVERRTTAAFVFSRVQRQLILPVSRVAASLARIEPQLASGARDDLTGARHELERLQETFAEAEDQLLAELGVPHGSAMKRATGKELKNEQST